MALQALRGQRDEGLEQCGFRCETICWVKITSVRVVVSSSTKPAETKRTAANNAAPGHGPPVPTREISSVRKKLARRPGAGYESRC
jgi:hypothetical protein